MRSGWATSTCTPTVLRLPRRLAERLVEHAEQPRGPVCHQPRLAEESTVAELDMGVPRRQGVGPRVQDAHAWLLRLVIGIIIIIIIIVIVMNSLVYYYLLHVYALRAVYCVSANRARRRRATVVYFFRERVAKRSVEARSKSRRAFGEIANRTKRRVRLFLTQNSSALGFKNAKLLRNSA